MNMPVFPSPCQLHFHNTPQFRLWLISFSWGQGLWRRTRYSVTFWTAPFLLPLMEAQAIFFLDTCYRNLVKLLEVNRTILLGPPYYGVPLEVLTLRLVHTDPSAIHQLQFKFYYSQYWLSPLFQLFLSLSLCSGKLHIPVFASRSQFWE